MESTLLGQFHTKPISIKTLSKRAFDILFTLVALIITAPIFLLIAFTIRLTSKGSIIYKQERIGWRGKPFHCYKFRTMHADASHQLTQLLEENPALKKEWEKTYKLKDDPRVTPFGKFLRKTSLDEIPQFWNILKGDLSTVGPRPLVLKEIEHFYGKKAGKILSVRPGLTGLWQTSGRSNLSYGMRVLLDEIYVDNQSLFFDVFLILKTIPVILFSKGAY
jgi:exopolysaccharide production protein ExoY